MSIYSESCACGSERPYGDCCYLLHSGKASADSPVQLMRSRYSAFALHLADYLLKTWHPSQRPMTLNLDDSPQWVKLQIVASSASGKKGKVHFRAYYRQHGDIGFMEERSEFVREQGQWLYVSGEVSGSQ